MITPVELIDKMIVLLTPEAAWIKKKAATDANGVAELPSAPEAVRWCITGARLKVQSDNCLGVNDPTVMVARTALQMASEKYGCVSPPHYNDLKTTTHRKMLNFLHEARLITTTLKPQESMKI